MKNIENLTRGLQRIADEYNDLYQNKITKPQYAEVLVFDNDTDTPTVTLRFHNEYLIFGDYLVKCSYLAKKYGSNWNVLSYNESEHIDVNVW